MYGAIFGDIIGSRFEFDRGGKTKDFELFTDESVFTDDTVMTVAVADGLIRAGKDASIDEIKTSVIKSMRYWAKKYPNAGYGGRFYQWLFHTRHPEPYGSYGNGSAMRVSAVGWLYDTLERTREVARATAEVTHNHPEGVKGADCTAAVIFLSRTGIDKEDIKKFVKETYNYDLSETLDQLRARHEHVESCQDSLPKALVSFFEGENYEDVVRNAVSLGGDTDTLGAIAGSMAEAYYGIPVAFYIDAFCYIPDKMTDVLNRFDDAIGRKSNEEHYDMVKAISETIPVINNYYQSFNDYLSCIEVYADLIEKGAEAPTPMIDVNQVTNSIDFSTIAVGDDFKLDKDLRLKIDIFTNPQGEQFIPLFTGIDELYKGDCSNINVNISLENLFKAAMADDIKGIVINPFSDSTILEKGFIEIVLESVNRNEQNA